MSSATTTRTARRCGDAMSVCLLPLLRRDECNAEFSKPHVERRGGAMRRVVVGELAAIAEPDAAVVAEAQVEAGRRGPPRGDGGGAEVVRISDAAVED